MAGRPEFKLTTEQLSVISDTFYKYKCRITEIAKHFNCSSETIYQYLKKHPDIKEIYDNVDKNITNEFVDRAETVVWYMAGLAKENPNISLRAATYILDKLGKKRGWVGDQNQINPDDTKFGIHYSNEE